MILLVAQSSVNRRMVAETMHREDDRKTEIHPSLAGLNQTLENLVGNLVHPPILVMISQLR